MPQEIEAKFIIPNPATFERLRSLAQIGGYALTSPTSKTFTDHYLDTADGLILRGGHACRLRHNHTTGKWAGTLKGLGGAQGAIHQREEHEVAIPPGGMPAQWPASEARDLALRLSQAQPLVERLIIHQQRQIRAVLHGERVVGEWSLDAVELVAGDRRQKTFELEIELGEAGTLDDLQALSAALAGYSLQPESKSKFERGLALLASR